MKVGIQFNVPSKLHAGTRIWLHRNYLSAEPATLAARSVYHPKFAPTSTIVIPAPTSLATTAHSKGSSNPRVAMYENCDLLRAGPKRFGTGLRSEPTDGRSRGSEVSPKTLSFRQPSRNERKWSRLRDNATFWRTGEAVCPCTRDSRIYGFQGSLQSIRSCL